MSLVTLYRDGEEAYVNPEIKGMLENFLAHGWTRPEEVAPTPVEEEAPAPVEDEAPVPVEAAEEEAPTPTEEKPVQKVVAPRGRKAQ